jgi:hypothetical protein
MSLGRGNKFFGSKNLAPPQNWTIGPGYTCGPPIQQAPSIFPLNNYSITTFPAAGEKMNFAILNIRIALLDTCNQLLLVELDGGCFVYESFWCR